AIPAVNNLLEDDRIIGLIDKHSRKAVLDLIREHLGEVRFKVGAGGRAPAMSELVTAIERLSADRWRPWPTRVINATGVVLHTNLGRAPMSVEATKAMQRAASGYSDLELDLESGTRGSRQSHISRLVSEVTGSEAAMVVNNNASAMLLVLAALASNKEVIVSRGEAVEIGGGFRIPDVLRQSGASLVEVGTTNRTYARDFESAISERTGAILSVHSSNFRVTGFTHTPSLTELVEIGQRHGVPVLHDLGSGCLLNTALFGLAPEPTAQESVRAGVTLGFFSGDKLLGGPQAGIVFGNADAIETVSRHPLARAVRIDKASIAALAATLLHYVQGEALSMIPIWRMITAEEDILKSRASDWRKAAGGNAEVVRGESAIGGGSLPGETLPTWLIRLPGTFNIGGAESVARALRNNSPPMIARIEGDSVLIDPRTVLPEDEEALVRALELAIASGTSDQC
ncbi:L-seryl-tRNA(Sec) selenium transferase, partial [Dehalococcoidia bacterium]|nr:L-seryl-tRNA(Sec) selenium transferase [Dehalococcoidia bacterium]